MCSLISSDYLCTSKRPVHPHRPSIWLRLWSLGILLCQTNESTQIYSPVDGDTFTIVVAFPDSVLVLLVNTLTSHLNIFQEKVLLKDYFASRCHHPPSRYGWFWFRIQSFLSPLWHSLSAPKQTKKVKKAISDVSVKHLINRPSAILFAVWCNKCAQGNRFGSSAGEHHLVGLFNLHLFFACRH